MASKLSDLLVLCDMDGTLLSSDMRLLRSNLETIRLFAMLGGNFTVATGRTVPSVARYAQMLDCMAPAITTGGTVLYDYKQNRIIRNTLLPLMAARRVIRDVLRAFPGIGVVVTGGDNKNYQVNPSPYAQKLFRDERFPYYSCPPEDLPDEWNKVLFAGSPELIEQAEYFMSKQVYPGVYYVAGSKNYLEIMPEGVNKGTAAKYLASSMGIDLENTIVIGDYFNDLDMMKIAGYSAAMQNAPREVKLLANEVIGSNDEGGVGQFLYKLMRKYA